MNEQQCFVFTFLHCIRHYHLRRTVGQTNYQKQTLNLAGFPREENYPSSEQKKHSHLSHKIKSSNGNIFRLTGLLSWDLPVTGEFPAQRSVTRSFDVFFDLRPLINGWVSNREAGDLRRNRTH